MPKITKGTWNLRTCYPVIRFSHSISRVDPRLDWLVMKKLLPVYWGRRSDRSRHQWPLLCRGITWPGPPSCLCRCTCCSFWMKLNRPWSFWAWWENWFKNICNWTGEKNLQYVCPNVSKLVKTMDIPKSLKKDPRSDKNQGVAQENNVCLDSWPRMISILVFSMSTCVFLVPNKPTFPLDKLKGCNFSCFKKEMPYTYRIPHKKILWVDSHFPADGMLFGWFLRKNCSIGSLLLFPTQRPFGGLFPSIGIAWHQLRYIRRNPCRWQ